MYATRVQANEISKKSKNHGLLRPLPQRHPTSRSQFSRYDQNILRLGLYPGPRPAPASEIDRGIILLTGSFYGFTFSVAAENVIQ
jgi:hypothetical protein